MCGDNPPKTTDVFYVSHWAQLIKVCFKNDLHSITRDDHPISWIIWTPEKIEAI